MSFLYPVPQPRKPVIPPSRFVTVTAATPVLTCREVLHAPRVLAREVRRGSYFFGLPEVVTAPGTGSGLLLSDQRNRLVRGG